MTDVARQRHTAGAGVLALVAGSAVWLAVTAAGIGGGLIGVGMAFSPLVALVIGVAISQMLFALFIPSALPNRELFRGRPARLMLPSTLLAIGLAAPLTTGALWNMHAYRVGGERIDVLGEWLILAALSFASWVMTLLTVSFAVSRRAERQI